MRLIFSTGLFACAFLFACSNGLKGDEFVVAYDNKNSRIPIRSDNVLFLARGTEAFLSLNASEAEWFLDLPIPLDYDNSGCADPECIQQIQHILVELSSLSGKRTVAIHDVPQLAGPGTHELIIKAGDRKTSVKLVIRRDDSYVGYLSELIGVPFVYGPIPTPEGHQTDLRQGADCVALIIYGKRRQGHMIPYVAPVRLYDFTSVIGDNSALDNVEIKEGDILHFGFQTAVISQDNAPIGRLSDNDMIIHSYHESVEERAFREIPYRNMNFDILRWKM